MALFVISGVGMTSAAFVEFVVYLRLATPLIRGVRGPTFWQRHSVSQEALNPTVRHRISRVQWWGLLVLAVVIGVLVAGRFFLTTFTVPGGQMYPTIAPGETILVRRNPYASIADIQRGDVVTAVDLLGRGRVGVWRVVGLPGEEIRTAASEIEISGVTTSREFHHHDREGIVHREALGTTTFFVTVGSNCPGPGASSRVPANHVFVLGDHRCATTDSRTFGPVSFEAITGRVILAF